MISKEIWPYILIPPIPTRNFWARDYEVLTWTGKVSASCPKGVRGNPSSRGNKRRARGKSDHIPTNRRRHRVFAFILIPVQVGLSMLPKELLGPQPLRWVANRTAKLGSWHPALNDIRTYFRYPIDSSAGDSHSFTHVPCDSI